MARQPSWLPDHVRLDDNLIPYAWAPPRDRYGTSDFEPHQSLAYRGAKLTAAEQEAIRAMWLRTYDIDAVCRAFGIGVVTLEALTIGV
jgi:hypothetical protein